jgi:hypothetical protein
MDKGKKYEVSQWLVKSQRDLGATRVLLESEQTYLDIAAYHYQQAELRRTSLLSTDSYRTSW